ncbi:DUF7563 family protein [Salinarchaeum laminariae]|uniref:DUF7563 family protein n=1 Tax=Salinarchaeum laminariae TaxID=869888 RepID=UPI0020BE11A0|nr:hypothetical protein [Salinarchaeum laminariae]
MSGAIPTPASRAAPSAESECRHCGEHLTGRFCRVFGDANGDVHRCFGCDSRRRVLSGTAAGKTVPYPDPERFRGESA